MLCPFTSNTDQDRECYPGACPLGRDDTCTFTAIADHLEHLGNVLDQRLEVIAMHLISITQKLGVISSIKPL